MSGRAMELLADGSARWVFRSMLCAGVLGAGAGGEIGIAHAQDTNITNQVTSQTAISLPSLSPLVKRVMPAVVNITVRVEPQAAAQVENEDDDSGAGPEATPFDQFMRRFFEQHGAPRPRSQDVTALGSGFIIDPSGYVVTNNHVVAQAQTVDVIFQDNSRHPAKIVGRDPLTDVALVKIEAPQPLPYLTWGDSGKAEVGDWIVAVGNPFGLGGTVTAGIVSARGRDIGAASYEDFLQLDAPINRGNSGGPTFNLSGEVIGINTAIFSPSGGSVGIGFAIPSDVAEKVVEQLKSTGHVEHGWLGVGIQNVTPAIAKSFGIDPNNPSGALVAQVEPNSPAAQAGLQQGDIITAANGEPVRTAHDLRRIVSETQVGQQVTLTAARAGKEQMLAATIGEMPAKAELASAEQPNGGAQSKPSAASALGLKLGQLTPDLRTRLHLQNGAGGVVVKGVADNSPAASLGLQPNDVIMSVDNQPVTTPQDADQKLEQATNKGQVLFLVNRGGQQHFVALSAQPKSPGNSSGSSSNPD